MTHHTIHKDTEEVVTTFAIDSDGWLMALLMARLRGRESRSAKRRRLQGGESWRSVWTVSCEWRDNL